MATVVNSSKIVISGHNACILEDKCLSKFNDHFPKFHGKKLKFLQNYFCKNLIY